MASKLEEDLMRQIEFSDLPQPEREYPTGLGKCRFDFAWPALMLAVEVEGGTFIRGRHQRPVGYANDCKKYNEAQLVGWTVLRFTSDMIRSRAAIDMIRRAIDVLMHYNNNEEK